MAHGERAKGKTATSISLSEDVLEAAKEIAADDGRTLSNWIEQMLREKIRETNRAKRPAKSAKNDRKRVDNAHCRGGGNLSA